MNLGYLCNIACTHCHVNAGPNRTELMDRATMAQALAVIDHFGIGTLDVTGGSPEMNPEFRWLVGEARARGVHVMDRLNPTIMEEPGYDWVAPFLAEHRVETIASLPCHSKENVDAQRGNGVFEASISALQTLNEYGYGKPDTGLVLNLVYNPVVTYYDYSASKAALVSLTRNMAEDCVEIKAAVGRALWLRRQCDPVRR